LTAKRGTRKALDTWTDEALMTACAKGSEPAFREIVERYQGKVLNLITRYVGDRYRAEELAQETFLRVHRHRTNYRMKGKFSSWLFTIAVNLARNELRNTKRRGPTVTIDPMTGTNDSGTLHLEDESQGPEDTTGRNEIAAIVRGAIMELPVHHREVLILRELQELTYEEIADILAIPGGTVRSRINRARLALKERLAPMAKALLPSLDHGLELTAS
jgi:RNA polymerase sigma-70 factor (ECF subfamily)